MLREEANVLHTYMFRPLKRVDSSWATYSSLPVCRMCFNFGRLANQDTLTHCDKHFLLAPVRLHILQYIFDLYVCVFILLCSQCFIQV